jgi:effector-binding domain-containing protein
MASHADDPVRIVIAKPRAIAAVQARLPIADVARRFAEYLDQVYAAARQGAVRVDGQNIFVYRGGVGPDGATDIEFGVGVAAPFPPVGRVRYSPLPTGEAAVMTLRGDYARLGETHGAIIRWCRVNGREIAGTCWEVYGHWDDDPARRTTDVYYLLGNTAGR